MEKQDAAVLRKQQEQRNAARASQREQDLTAIMKTTHGRRFVMDLLVSCGCDPSRTVTSMTGNSRTYELEGMRKVGVTLQAEVIDKCEDLYFTMLREHFDSKRANSNDRTNRTDG